MTNHHALGAVRSLLFVPGDRREWLAKAERSNTDAIALDLEDSVPDELVTQARRNVADRARCSRGLSLLVRTHAPDDDRFELDLAAAVGPATTAVILPKVAHPSQIEAAQASLAAKQRATDGVEDGIGLVLLIESARAIVNLTSMIAASPLVIGAMFAGARDGDLARDLGATWTVDGATLLYARSRVLLECRAAGLPLIMDSVYADVRDLEGLRGDSRFSADLGFTGRPAVHPTQVQPINEAFAPSAAAVADAQGVLDAYQAALDAGTGATTYQGRLVDRAMAENAQRLLSRVRTMNATE